jgi:hypothetical protein
MAKLNKKKVGLQKRVSSVFKGVPFRQNNGAQQPSGTPAPDHTPDVSPKPAFTDSQILQSPLNKLNQSEDSLDKAEQNQTANISPKPTSTNRMPQSPPINKLNQSEDSLDKTEQFATFVNTLERHQPVLFVNEFTISRSNKGLLTYQVSLDVAVFEKKQQEREIADKFPKPDFGSKILK